MTEKSDELHDPTDMSHDDYDSAKDPTSPFYEGNRWETEQKPDPSDDDTYKVGPGYPPKQHTWKKGGPSPNKKGRPKKIPSMKPDLKKALETALNEKVEITKDKKNVLQEGYAWLSEFAHPNFCSHSNAFKLDKATGRMVFRHEDELRKEDDLQHVCYLAISAQLFVAMYDVFGAQAEKCLIE